MTSPLVAARILVVDDERAVAAAVARRLEKDGAKGVTSHSGGEAGGRPGPGRFDVLVTDVQMPGRSGLELLDQAQHLAEPPAVILMAADGDVANTAGVLARGADGFVRKPLD